VNPIIYHIIHNCLTTVKCTIFFNNKIMLTLNLFYWLMKIFGLYPLKMCGGCGRGRDCMIVGFA
jgi:hypothetical protein